jgi:hypothetical protein
MQDQLTVSSSVLPSCAQHSCHHLRLTQKVTEHVLLTIPPPPPPLQELGQLRVHKLLGQVLATAAVATARRRRRACAQHF